MSQPDQTGHLATTKLTGAAAGRHIFRVEIGSARPLAADIPIPFDLMPLDDCAAFKDALNIAPAGYRDTCRNAATRGIRLETEVANIGIGVPVDCALVDQSLVCSATRRDLIKTGGGLRLGNICLILRDRNRS